MNIFPDSKFSFASNVVLSSPTLTRIARRASVLRPSARTTTAMETHMKASPFKDIKSFFSPKAAAAGAEAGKGKGLQSNPDETRPNCGKLDFASAVPVKGLGKDDTMACSDQATANVNQREALATVANANGAKGGTSTAPGPNQNCRDSDLTAPDEHANDGTSPAGSVGFTTPAGGLRAIHKAVDADDTPLANTQKPVRPYSRYPIYLTPTI